METTNLPDSLLRKVVVGIMTRVVVVERNLLGKGKNSDTGGEDQMAGLM